MVSRKAAAPPSSLGESSGAAQPVAPETGRSNTAMPGQVRDSANGLVALARVHGRRLLMRELVPAVQTTAERPERPRPHG